MSLPSGYTRLEYIESTGTQYINTGVSAPEGMRVEYQAEFTSLRSGLNMLFGSHDAADPYYRNYLAANSAGNLELGAYGVATFGAITTGRKYSIDVCTISGDIFAKIDGMSYYIGDIAPSTKRSSLSVYLFALHYAGGLLWASAKLYGAKIYLNASGSNPTRDFIPCKNAFGVVGMWDDVNGQFYTNVGTGAFTAGPETKPNLTAHKTLVNGTAYTVQSGKCMVGGTVYNILKGRTLIDGTGYDVALPTPMPKKGDLIQMNLDGTSRQYRVLRMDGSIAEVLTMWNLSTSIKFNSTNTYSGSILDTYLNTTWYNTLSSDAKAAIVPKNITQDSWHRGTTGSPQYSGTYGNTAPGSTSYTISKGSDNYRAIGSRYVYAISIQEILDYLSDNSVLVDTSGMLRNQNIWKMFWNQTTDISEFLWLRSASADDYILAWYVNGYFGYPGNDRAFNENAVRGALQIDLSKIDFTIT